jgi:transcriptional regulator with XRE-family HTH domain
MSAEELAHKVGYATQSGIANLENRATGRGGYKLAQIAKVLNVSLEWLLHGDNNTPIAHVPPYTVEEPASDWHGQNWPFHRISRAQWNNLTPMEREMLERQIAGLIFYKQNIS